MNSEQFCLRAKADDVNKHQQQRHHHYQHHHCHPFIELLLYYVPDTLLPYLHSRGSITPLCRFGNKGTEKSSNFLEDTDLVNGKVRIWICAGGGRAHSLHLHALLNSPLALKELSENFTLLSYLAEYDSWLKTVRRYYITNDILYNILTLPVWQFPKALLRYIPFICRWQK